MHGVGACRQVHVYGRRQGSHSCRGNRCGIRSRRKGQRRRNRWSKHRGEGRVKNQRRPCLSRRSNNMTDGRGNPRVDGRRGDCGTEGHGRRRGDSRCEVNRRDFAGNRDSSDCWWKERWHSQRLGRRIGPEALPGNRYRQGNRDHHPINRASPVCPGTGCRSFLAVYWLG